MTRRSRATASSEADALGLEGVGEGVDFERELAQGVVAGGAAGAEGVVLFAESGDDVGEGLDGADGFFDEGGENQQQNEREDGESSDERSGGDVEKGEESGGEADDGEGSEGAEDAQAHFEGEALAGGLARCVAVRHVRRQRTGTGHREQEAKCRSSRLAAAYVAPVSAQRTRSFSP